ncbi:hypothetical protein K493DRAFT_254083 [Basidiobolus meristosporus CBS 931.73]|uniref:Ribosomal protein L10 n=1 Tax=Basidiobolus meristosporus CBS 931.73 TaxID=1314790 RepID=A0A1Y1Z093_9FUNG|nr:hypothetical protein K493DRAFT_254083 [Basidiobolus meristosporus CBS 931.73]|eukprot:ORY03629.1 hypothetical protein K493DRAFT_254083 [Basidiobolus meristosporus CBS 931.73]
MLSYTSSQVLTVVRRAATINAALPATSIRSFATAKKELPWSRDPSKEYPLRKSFLHAEYLKRLEAPVIVVLQHNNLTVPEFIEARSQLKKAGVKLQTMRTGILRVAIKKTRYENLTPLLYGPVCFAYTEGAEAPNAITAILEVANKNKKLNVLGGKVENSLANIEDLALISKLPSLDQLRSELLGTLDHPGRTIHNMLNRHPQSLLQALSQHEKNLSGESS